MLPVPDVIARAALGNRLLDAGLIPCPEGLQAVEPISRRGLCKPQEFPMGVAPAVLAGTFQIKRTGGR